VHVKISQHLVLAPSASIKLVFSLSILHLGTLVTVFSYAGMRKKGKSTCQGTYVVLVVISRKFAMEFSMKFNRTLGQNWLKSPPFFVHAQFLPNPVGWSVSIVCACPVLVQHCGLVFC